MEEGNMEEQYMEEENGREEVHVDEQQDGVDISKFPGGPYDTSVLKDYKTHVACEIWDTEDLRILRCVQHTDMLAQWNIEGHRIEPFIEKSGLKHLARITYKKCCKVWISALVERWHPDTNTFHMPFGEMTITLDDVQQLINIPVFGRAVVAPEVKMGDLVKICTNALGVNAQEIELELRKCKRKYLRLDWLRDQFKELPEDASQYDLECAARAYLLYLLGCTIFCDKSGKFVPVKYLHLLMGLEDVSRYAWGAAALAYLYRQLGMASRSKVRQITGYLTLVEAWSYEHLRIERPPCNTNFGFGEARALRWMPSRRQATYHEKKLVDFREALDDLKANEVIWDPYHKDRTSYALPQNAVYSGMLFCCEVIEPISPLRVLRQFGFKQTIPPPPPKPSSGYDRNALAKNYIVNYDGDSSDWNRSELHQLSSEECGEHVTQSWDCAEDYLEWYHSITHKVVQNPARRMDTTDDHYTKFTEELQQRRDKARALLEQSLVCDDDDVDIESLRQNQRAVLDVLNNGIGEHSKLTDKGEGQTAQEAIGKRQLKGKRMLNDAFITSDKDCE